MEKFFALYLLYSIDKDSVFFKKIVQASLNNPFFLKHSPINLAFLILLQLIILSCNVLVSRVSVRFVKEKRVKKKKTLARKSFASLRIAR